MKRRAPHSGPLGSPGSGPPGVVIVGAGFGGLAAAGELSRHGVAVTLVDRHQYTTFQPLLYQVATAGLNLEDVAFPIRTLLRRRRSPGSAFVQGSFAGVDWGEPAAILQGGRRLPFERLVLATGASTSFFGVPGAQDHALPLYTLDDAARLRQRLVLAVERAAASGDRLRAVIIGGGPTGVETAGALAELRSLLEARDYPELRRSGVQLQLLEMGPRVLASFNPKLSAYAARELARRQVMVRTGCRVEQVRPHALSVTGGEQIPYDLLVWAAGVGVPPDPALGDLARTRSGRLEVTRALQLKDHPNAFAIGDVAAMPGARAGELPQLAQPAIQAGRHVARQLLRADGGIAPLPFTYHDRGTMATIGRRSAVAQLRGGVRLTGSPAWLAWLGLHLTALMGGRNRVSVLLNWIWRYLLWRRSSGLIVGPPIEG